MKVLLLLLGLVGGAWCLFGDAPGSASPTASEAQLTYWGNGQRRAALACRDGVPHGPAREWFPDGRLANEGAYLDGQRDGPWTFWREDGSIDEERSGLYRAGRKVPPTAIAQGAAASASYR